MITEKERKALKEVFPCKYGKTIAERLNERGKRPSRAERYTPKIIGQVFRSEQHDLNAELEIFKYRDEILEDQKELEKLRNKTITQPEGENQ